MSTECKSQLYEAFLLKYRQLIKPLAINSEHDNCHQLGHLGGGATGTFLFIVRPWALSSSLRSSTAMKAVPEDKMLCLHTQNTIDFVYTEPLDI